MQDVYFPLTNYTSLPHCHRVRVTAASAANTWRKLAEVTWCTQVKSNASRSVSRCGHWCDCVSHVETNTPESAHFLYNFSCCFLFFPLCPGFNHYASPSRDTAPPTQYKWPVTWGWGNFSVWIRNKVKHWINLEGVSGATNRRRILKLIQCFIPFSESFELRLNRISCSSAHFWSFSFLKTILAPK